MLSVQPTYTCQLYCTVILVDVYMFVCTFAGHTVNTIMIQNMTSHLLKQNFSTFWSEQDIQTGSG
jgi:hypothetical protein